ncbi:MAG: PKD domain-containing protein, partial [Bacteroidetes bacterium]|nr:PKD domain-containing protein [Bacteroidota bacterium]
MKNRKHFYYLVLLFISITVSFQAKAQISQGGQPYSFSKANLNNSQVPFSVMPAVDVAARMAEDVYNDPQKSIPWRFGENIAVNLNLGNSGTWDIMPNGDKLWRLGINAPGAISINLIFDHYNLPADAKLFIYAPNKSEIIGAFTDFNNRADGAFATTLMHGDSIILEYFEPSNASFPGEVSINNVTHGYRNGFEYAKNFGGSGTCQNNVACPISSGWTNEVNSACMLVSGGSGFCSGSLVNNTSNDGTPYILTANHCYSNPSTWVFWFNWQSPTCTNPGSSPTYNSISGATLKAQNVASDFCLVQMSSTPPAAYNVYYAGWNNNATAATSTTCIHHPAGDIKKFSTAGAATSVAAYNAGNGNAECWNVSWTSGCTEGGSSGSPLFDQNHLIVGQLYGGPSACGAAASSMNDYYGKFSISWNTGTTAATRLKDWLDPTNTGATTLPGFNPVSPQAPVANFSANVTTSCTGSINFTDLSANSPTSWIWYFGDGTTATTQNPTHAYTASGTYTVSLKSTNAIGNDSIAKVSYITINMPTIPTVTGGSRCGTGTVNLSATGSGTLQWYAAAAGGTALTTGTTYTTPSISATTTYYVENHIVQPSAYVGPLANFAAGAYSTTGYTLNFNCLAPCTLVSVAVDKQTAGNVLIQLTTSTGTVLQSGTFPIAAGPSRVTLNWPLTAGTGLKLVSPGNVGFWRVNTGGTFPYTLAGLVSITSCSSTTRYGSYFDWEIKEPDCISSRTPIVATVNAMPTATATPVGATAICAGNSV